MLVHQLQKSILWRVCSPHEIARKVLEVYNLEDKERIIKRCKALSRNWTREESSKSFKKAFNQVLGRISASADRRKS